MGDLGDGEDRNSRPAAGGRHASLTNAFNAVTNSDPRETLFDAHTVLCVLLFHDRVVSQDLVRDAAYRQKPNNRALCLPSMNGFEAQRNNYETFGSQRERNVFFFSFRSKITRRPGTKGYDFYFVANTLKCTFVHD